jgi:hypothetical protein
LARGRRAVLVLQRLGAKVSNCKQTQRSGNQVPHNFALNLTLN